MTSRRLESVKPSATMAMTSRATQLRREGRDIVSLSVGEPDFPVFPHVEQAVSDALRKGYTKYTAPSGLLELREAISDWMFREVGQRWPASQIIATAGGKQALYNACMALLDDGDEALIPNPYWVSYPEMVRLSGGKPAEMMLRQEDGWAPRPEDLERALGPRTRMFIFSSPSNPTGAVWSAEVMKGVARVLERFPRVTILSDDIYDKLVYGGAKTTNILQIAPQLKDRTVLINGCSKAYAMTGLRLGWACGPAEIISGMGKVQDASTSNPSSLSQHAAVAALRGPQEPLEAMRVQFEKRRHLMVQLLRQIPGVEAHDPDGAYYVFADFSGLLLRKFRGEPLASTQRLAEVLLEEFGVATVPGSAFGREGFLRLSFAISEADIRKAMERVARCAQALE
ncbi:MAG TPA: pyridoxal phosphate-dependent aminotransferase [Myxococcales bacterium]|nr:pyridoxal phosphate-dependent aminotransferase [Myxococcales bacterium]